MKTMNEKYDDLKTEFCNEIKKLIARKTVVIERNFHGSVEISNCEDYADGVVTIHKIKVSGGELMAIISEPYYYENDQEQEESYLRDEGLDVVVAIYGIVKEKLKNK